MAAEMEGGGGGEKESQKHKKRGIIDGLQGTDAEGNAYALALLICRPCLSLSPDSAHAY